jgi:hypothetical protein
MFKNSIHFKLCILSFRKLKSKEPARWLYSSVYWKKMRQWNGFWNNHSVLLLWYRFMQQRTTNNIHCFNSSYNSFIHCSILIRMNFFFITLNKMNHFQIDLVHELESEDEADCLVNIVIKKNLWFEQMFRKYFVWRKNKTLGYV